MPLKTLVLAACAAMLLGPGQVVAGDIAVGVNDTLELRAAMWNAADGTVEDVEIVSGSYVVGAAGRISVPLVGAVEAAGRTPEDIAAELETAMAGYSDVGRTPRIAVGVERYAPIYLAGEVEKPGLYEYAPGMTVLKAVALAGGASQIEPLAGEERNYLIARGAARELHRELQFLEARRDRLRAEQEGAGKLDAPAGADSADAADGATRDIRATEAAILAMRNDRVTRQRAFLDKAEALLTEAIEVLEKKRATNTAQLEAGREELTREEDLVERGLVPQARLFERVRYVSEVESRVLDIERSILLARQDLRRVEEDRLLLETNRSETVITDLQEVNTKIAEAEARLEAQYALMSQALGEQVDADRIEALAGRQPDVLISRSRGGETRNFLAGRVTEVLPGDVIELRLPDDAASTN